MYNNIQNKKIQINSLCITTCRLYYFFNLLHCELDLLNAIELLQKQSTCSYFFLNFNGQKIILKITSNGIVSIYSSYGKMYEVLNICITCFCLAPFQSLFRTSLIFKLIFKHINFQIINYLL